MSGGGTLKSFIVLDRMDQMYNSTNNATALQNALTAAYVSGTVGGSTESQLKTESLTLDNKQRIVHTDAPVVMTDPSGVTRATGMKAWIDERIVELNSQVEGQYESSSPR